MNRFLYKYMPIRTNFFFNPMIRATPITVLNDPFEGHFNNKQLRDIHSNQQNYYKNNGMNVNEEEIDEYLINEIAGVTQTDFFDLGIISFTEEPNNILMWAHYADQHKGIVIEFDFNQPFFMDSIFENNRKKSRFKKDYFGEIFEYPEKVNYRKEMPNFERIESAVPDSPDEYHWKKFNKTILFTKANDWIYEKEQRSIVKLRDADSIICEDDKEIRNICLNNPTIKLEKIGKNKIQIYFPNEFEMNEEIGDESIKDEIYRITLNYNFPPIHLFRINPKSISAIYFGTNANYENALKDIKNNSSLAHLTHIYKMEHDKNYYLLNSIKL